MAYAKRYAGGFADLPSLTTAIDSTFLNAVESALLSLFDANPGAQYMVPIWTPTGTHYVPGLITNNSIDPAAAIAKSKLAALAIVDADVAGGASIARSKLNFGSGLVDADIAAGAAIAKSKLAALAIAQSDMASGNKITSSAMSGGPPGSPADGDIWIATAVNATGCVWMFRYNNSETTYKWEFIGGTPLYASDFPAVVRSNTADSTWEFIAGNPSITLPRTGQYRWTFSAYQSMNNTTGQISVAKTSTPATNPSPTAILGSGVAGAENVTTSNTVDDVANSITRTAADVVGLVQWTSNHLGSNVQLGMVCVQPVRII